METLPLFNCWLEYFSPFWISEEQQRQKGVWDVYSYLCLEGCTLSTSCLKKIKAIHRKNMSLYDNAEIFLEIRIKNKFIPRKVLF